MDSNLKSLIENTYNIQIKDIKPGPRQFVAETFLLNTESGLKYFTKIIQHNKYSQNTIEGLPVLEQLFENGIKNINHPIKTRTGGLYLLFQNKLIILFNYINAIQTFDYSNKKFGELIAEIHAVVSKISITIPKENFSLLYREDFAKFFQEALNPIKSDVYINEMSSIIKSYETEIKQDWKVFQAIISECKNTAFDLVITHGDAPVNILVDQKQNIYLVDWDNILLAPAERDTWFMRDSKEFMDSYSSVFPEYKINFLADKFYLYNRYFEDMYGFIEEILSDKSIAHKEKNLNDLKKDCFNKWLRPLIRSLN